MREKTATNTTTFKCEGCGKRFTPTHLYTGPPLAAATSTFVCVCSFPCFEIAQAHYRLTKRFSY